MRNGECLSGPRLRIGTGGLAVRSSEGGALNSDTIAEAPERKGGKEGAARIQVRRAFRCLESAASERGAVLRRRVAKKNPCGSAGRHFGAIQAHLFAVTKDLPDDVGNPFASGLFTRPHTLRVVGAVSIEHKGAVKPAAPDETARFRRRLMSSRTIRVPDAAFAGGRIMSGRDVATASAHHLSSSENVAKYVRRTRCPAVVTLPPSPLRLLTILVTIVSFPAHLLRSRRRSFPLTILGTYLGGQCKRHGCDQR